MEIAISTLVIIILGIFVLIALVLFFTGGFERFSGNLEETSPSDTQVTISACKAACDSGLKYDFCERLREVDGFVNVTCRSEIIDVKCDSITC